MGQRSLYSGELPFVRINAPATPSPADSSTQLFRRLGAFFCRWPRSAAADAATAEGVSLELAGMPADARKQA